jgi:hypothetical protein
MDISEISVGDRIKATSKYIDDFSRPDVVKITVTRVSSSYISNTTNNALYAEYWNFELVPPTVEEQIRALPDGTHFVTLRGTEIGFRVAVKSANGWNYLGDEPGWFTPEEITSIQVITVPVRDDEL